MDCKQKLAIIENFGRVIANEHNIDKLLQKIADFAKELIEADRCSIFIYDEKKNELWTKVAHKVDRIKLSAQKGIVGHTARTQNIQMVVDAYKNAYFYPQIDKQTGYRTKTVLAVPLVDHTNKTIGVFQALNKKNGSFTQKDADILLLISSYTASALENSLLYQRLHQSNLKIITKLTTAAEFKDEETSYHTKRVGEYAALLGEKLDLPYEKVETLRYTAPMHDVGKIGISDAILLKPSKLTPQEFEIMKTHSFIGYNILKDSENELLQEASLIALEHHEKYDGSGYPYGKAKEEISIEGRIVAVADVFDALTSLRPYKKAWSIEEAFDYIQAQKGKHFDPRVVEAFFAIKEKILHIKQIFKD